ncbi:mechanosensitive ion channel family protein [Nocardia seriolae]|uniref:Large-conductance mechanosensitive channel MscMJLR n=1 Tax=Nocardia seriolae TaxID=37332 RepID=A0A0B8ND94_9NOCA|nr:mechanosensitive ion channel family protein [Nocardia seriolae]APA98148.1 Large-conductance mechanosensitive channel MscMJLR [Nocardia seriolae]MTJ62833.1 mechanosensitive ion channel [Nocardia seriolae]MTJ73509.1 mechanosensitive ion channel [Nocardia seriolae]MTJ87867.1 mechanosensitive ion channel [Nocardia seriolae]MTK31860.1 mechanosensitive ion channel [Nocardia seriolae]
MNKPLIWALTVAIAILGPLVGIMTRRLVGRIAAKTSARNLAVHRMGFGLARDLAVPLCSLTGLLIALSLPNGLPFSPRAVHQVLEAAFMIAVTYALARLAAEVVTTVARRITGISGSVSLFSTITRVIVFVLGVLITLDSVGVQITPLLGALGIGALAIALALEGTLANLFAGVHILASKTVQPGDFVKLDSGETGWVSDVNWRTTTIQDIPGNFIIVPNRKFADAILTNFHRPEQDMAVTVDVSTSYDSDLEHVEAVTLEVARKVMKGLDVGFGGADPRVRFHTFGESGIEFRVVLRTRHYEDQYLLVSEFIKALHRRYRQEGITIPYPMRTLSFAPNEDLRSLLPAGLHTP